MNATIGKQECNETGFGEQYHVTFADGDTANVYVWVRPEMKEKDNHKAAVELCILHYPGKEVEECIYC